MILYQFLPTYGIAISIGNQMFESTIWEQLHGNRKIAQGVAVTVVSEIFHKIAFQSLDELL